MLFGLIASGSVSLVLAATVILLIVWNRRDTQELKHAIEDRMVLQNEKLTLEVSVVETTKLNQQLKDKVAAFEGLQVSNESRQRALFEKIAQHGSATDVALAVDELYATPLPGVQAAAVTSGDGAPAVPTSRITSPF